MIENDISRRTFARTSLATGFAAAVLPVGADTITTDTAGLEAGEVKIKVKDGEMPIVPCHHQARISRSFWWCRKSLA